MRLSTKCSVALHILAVLVIFEKEKLTSNALAKSTGCNPVIVRNILGDLKAAGMVDVRRGQGGASLCMQPEAITVWDVFDAVDPSSLEELMGLHPSPSQNCPVGRNIYALLEKPYSIVEEAVKGALQSYTLRQILDDLNSKLNDKGEAHNENDGFVSL